MGGRRLRRGDLTPEERKRAQDLDRRSTYLRETGRPLMVPPHRAAAHARRLHEMGMSGRDMALQSGLHPNTFLDLVRGERPRNGQRRPLAPIMRETEEKVLAVRFAPPAARGAALDGTGAVRRMRALTADGFGGPFLGGRLGTSVRRVTQIMLPRSETVSKELHDRIAGIYEELEGKEPADFDLSSKGVLRARLAAGRKGWAPRRCWDDDTIDDPTAGPEWTGHCGSWWGWHIHVRDGVPMCPACEPFAASPPYPGFDGQLLRELRERRGYSRARLGGLVEGVNAATIQYWETGRSKPVRQNKLDRVLAQLDATFEDVSRTEEEEHGR